MKETFFQIFDTSFNKIRDLFIHFLSKYM